MWRREDGRSITANGHTKKATSVSGTSLVFDSVGRGHIGSYLCIASNGVPPSISKRVDLRVQFPPMMSVPSQLESVPLGGNVTLKCRSEAFPASINYWIREGGETVTSGGRFKMASVVIDHVTRMRLEIHRVEARDFTSYKCVAKNSLGETDGKIRLFEVETEAKATRRPRVFSSTSQVLPSRRPPRRRTTDRRYAMYEPHTPGTPPERDWRDQVGLGMGPMRTSFASKRPPLPPLLPLLLLLLQLVLLPAATTALQSSL